jgi:hypothetical protein
MVSQIRQFGLCVINDKIAAGPTNLVSRGESSKNVSLADNVFPLEVC